MNKAEKTGSPQTPEEEEPRTPAEGDEEVGGDESRTSPGAGEEAGEDPSGASPEGEEPDDDGTLDDEDEDDEPIGGERKLLWVILIVLSVLVVVEGISLFGHGERITHLTNTE